LTRDSREIAVGEQERRTRRRRFGCASTANQHLWHCGPRRPCVLRASCGGSSCWSHIRSEARCCQSHVLNCQASMPTDRSIHATLFPSLVFQCFKKVETYAGHGSSALEPSPDAIVDTLGLTPVWLDTFEAIGLMSVETRGPCRDCSSDHVSSTFHSSIKNCSSVSNSRGIAQ
jgi:hypothetical protein